MQIMMCGILVIMSICLIFLCYGIVNHPVCSLDDNSKL